MRRGDRGGKKKTTDRKWEREERTQKTGKGSEDNKNRGKEWEREIKCFDPHSPTNVCAQPPQFVTNSPEVLLLQAF